MKLAILSRNSKLYSTQRLVEAGRVRGHSVRVLDPLRYQADVTSMGLTLGVYPVTPHYIADDKSLKFY